MSRTITCDECETTRWDNIDNCPVCEKEQEVKKAKSSRQFCVRGVMIGKRACFFVWCNRSKDIVSGSEPMNGPDAHKLCNELNAEIVELRNRGVAA